MGIHLHLQTLNDEDHPEWDYLRMQGDSDLYRFLMAHGNPHYSGDYFRISTYPAIPDDCPNPVRWKHLMSLLVTNPHHWVYISW